MRRILYWKRLLIVTAVTLLLGGAVFAVHRFQTKNQSSIFRERAEKAAAAAETDPTQRAEALELYRKYLKFRPDDEAAFQKYAQLLLAQAKAEPATAALAADGIEGFLRAFPNHPAERQKLADLYIATSQFPKLTLAKQHLAMLLTAPGEYRTNVEVLEAAAECERGLGDVPAAIVHLDAAIVTGNAPVRVYQQAMRLHYSNKEDRDRKNKIDPYLVALRSGRFANNLEARIAAARFEMALGNIVPARNDLDIAFGRKPGYPNLGGDNDATALLAQSELDLADLPDPKQIDAQRVKAEANLRKAFGLDPKNVSVGMKLAEVLTNQGKRDEGVQILKRAAESLGAIDANYLVIIDRLIDLGEQEVSSGLVEGKVAANEALKPYLTYFRGRLAVLKQDWTTALKLLEEAAPGFVRLPEYHKRAMVGIATCYSAMQNPDKQLEYCRNALRDDNGYSLAVLGEAEAMGRMGKHDEALKRYRLIVNAYKATDFRPELVRLELLDVLSQPGEASARNWVRFDESLGPVPYGADIAIYHADSLLARGRAAEGATRLREWLTANPKDARAAAVWVALARVQDGGRADTATAVLEEAQKAVGDAIEIRLARAGLLVARAKPAIAAEFEALAAGSEKFPVKERFRLLFGLGQAAARVGDRGPEGDPAKALRATATALIRAAADLNPKDLSCRAVLLDQALSAGRMDTVEQVIKEMAVVEGETGPVGTLARIAVRFPQVKNLADPAARAAGIKELRELAIHVRDMRPGWSRVYIALAQLEELEGLNDAALLSYREAIDRGDRQEFVIRRTVDLYRIKQQDLQAVGLLNKLSTEVQLPEDLERYRAISDLLSKPAIAKESRPTIDRIAPTTSSDYRVFLLRGALLEAIRENADALTAFYRAVELGDKMPEAWASLVAQLMKHGKLEEARRAVDEAEKKLKPTPALKNEVQAERELALAGLHEQIGNLKRALERYTAARDLAPLELNPTRQLVLFLQRTGQGDKAVQLLNGMTTSGAADVARWARRHLALTMMARADKYTFRTEAMTLIERNLAISPNDAEDLKARAVIWTVDPVTREEGVRTLRQFGDRGDLTPDEFYLLGRLAFDQGKFEEAEKYFKLAARPRPGVPPEYMAALVQVHLARNLTGLAADAAERLRTTHPTSWEATREEARVLLHKSKDKAGLDPEEAKKLIAQARAALVAFPGWDTVPNIPLRSAPLLEELGLLSEAEELYRKYLTANAEPNPHAPLAFYHVRRKQPDKAIELAWKHEKTTSPLLTAQILTGAVRARRPDRKTEAEIETWLDTAIRAAAGNARLEAALTGTRAQLLDAQEKYKEAIAEYERSLKAFRSDLVVNNLCMLLALHAPERAPEAIKMMDDVIAIRGPQPTFLDTRAVAYLVNGRPAEAEKDIRMALVQYDQAGYRYHLAWALDLDNAEAKRGLAARELEKAKRLGLTADDLHAIEFKRYTELLTKYNIPLPK